MTDGRAMILTMFVTMFVHTAHHRAQCEVFMPGEGDQAAGLYVLKARRLRLAETAEAAVAVQVC